MIQNYTDFSLNGEQGKGEKIVPAMTYSHLLSKEEIISIPEDQLCCPEYGKAYQAFPATRVFERYVVEHDNKRDRQTVK